MEKQLPARPNLDHLRRQAKALLSNLERRESNAVATILKHLPTAKTMTAELVHQTRFRLADAQSAIARQSGFAAWSHLARHVEQLRSLEGSWAFSRLEIDGTEMPSAALRASSLLIDGDRFRTETPEGPYEGVFNINVEAEPHEIDIEFVEGPEAGNWNHGIFRLRDDQLEICLDMNGKQRPIRFGTSPGSGHACEMLKRISNSRPHEVDGGTARTRSHPAASPGTDGFEYVSSPTLTKLQGEWNAVKIVRDGQELPAMVLRTALRTGKKNEVTVMIGGRVIVHALIRVDESTDPLQVDYYNVGGMAKDTVQHGILAWNDSEARFCMSGPGDPRPVDFQAPAGSGRTFSEWRLKK